MNPTQPPPKEEISSAEEAANRYGEEMKILYGQFKSTSERLAMAFEAGISWQKAESEKRIEELEGGLKIANTVVEQLQRAAKFQKEQYEGLQLRRGELCIERDTLRAKLTAAEGKIVMAREALEWIKANGMRDSRTKAEECLALLDADKKETDENAVR